MPTRKPKVGDAAIIDGCDCEITFVGPGRVDFKCLERLEYEAKIAELRAMPMDTEEVRKEYQKKGQAGPLEAAANAAKEEFMAEHNAKLPPMAERQRLVSHGCIMPGGQRTSAHPKKVYWVEHAGAWTCFGRLLSRAEVVKTHVDDNGVICDTHDEHGECIVTEQSDRKRYRIHRKQGQAFDPAHEIAAHIAHATTTAKA
jgi:hypothetical protein